MIKLRLVIVLAVLIAAICAGWKWDSKPSKHAEPAPSVWTWDARAD
jgi:hypothetical protein